MKLALLTDGIYPYVIGGMQKHSFCLAKYFAINGVHVDLYHMNKSNYDISRLEFFSAEEKAFIRSFVIDFPEKMKLPGHYLRGSYEYSIRIFELFMRNSDVDFIYAKGFSGWKLIEEKAKGFKCPPIGINFHGYEMFQSPPSFKARIEQIFYFRNPVLFNVKKADYVFSYGGKISELILNLGIENKKIIEMPAGIEEDWLVNNAKSSDKRRKFVYLGRYERRKGIEELNRSLIQIIDKYDFDFHFIGDIPDSKKIVSKKIIYHGNTTDSVRIRSLLQACDVLVCPSYSEGMPNVILEAMASGLAIMATDVGAVNLMVSHSNGWLLSSPDVIKLVSALKEAINLADSDLIAMKNQSIYNVKEKFVWSKIIGDTIRSVSGLL